ncbi:deoxyribodipyrimidine photo-lyase [Kitasatospora sp. SolWspMP-SS2h]|uniref:cryptochrome/photolyase family protein n=1 Tax=Kitasatospora sp. SolWspMP-SS2h TaxID=1305729 RepID=UPI000DBA7F01|nr:deoxyribodipyrimidine photo-lyase [Kitasatospora sp. SolWspMP-SS2h]RAJ44854.1 deoxyribodipyrimidine photo-lyase [Kitasatospora sp. SolWspMP-SS2h]
MTLAIVLFTQDLRLHDNPALHAARAGADRVVPLFVTDPAIAAAGFAAPNRAAFLAGCLAELDAALRGAGGRLLVREGDTADQAARLAAETGAASVHVAAGVSGYAHRREQRLRAALGERLRVHDASLTAVPPGAVQPAGRDHYAVFTPYHRAWQQAPRRTPLPAPSALRTPEDLTGAPLPTATPTARSLPDPGEAAARRAWQRWHTDDYAALHDDLAADGTSHLSPYLHFGCLSANELAHLAERRGGHGADAFVRQLVWRDFHHQVLAARPDAARADYRHRPGHWHEDPEELAAWREGRTGFPIIDAGMRQLAETGWMHNRARLLTASFLAKTLRQDWRPGAAHFLHHLVDGDLANNQMNWQWVAGTGTDTRPNRVLNPLTQADRYDPSGDYVRRWLPELADLPGREIHRPWQSPHRPDSYPAPLIAPDATGERMRQVRRERENTPG